MTTVSAEPVPGISAPTFTYDAVFDTNAIRTIGELPKNDFIAFRRAAMAVGLRTAWLEETLGELMVTNLNRKGGCTDAAIYDSQVAMWRFDQLSGGKLCPGVNTLVRRSIYALAGAAPPAPDPDDRGAGWRQTMDDFMQVRSTEDLRIVKGPPLHSEFRSPRGKGTCQVFVPQGFVPFVADKVKSWRERARKEGGLKALKKDGAIMKDWDKWAVATGDQLGIPRETLKVAFWVVENGVVRRRPPEDVLNTAFAWRLVPWNLYAAMRVTGRKPGVRENDGRDISLTTYLSVAGRLVTDDKDLRKLLRVVVADPRRIVGLDEFRKLLAASRG